MAPTEAAAAVQTSELSFVCVGTPARPNGSQDLRALERVAVELGRALATKTAPHVIVVRSTVLPGTIDSVFVPLVERYSGRRCGDSFDVCFQPEFLREGTSIADYDKPPFTICGAAVDPALGIVAFAVGKNIGVDQDAERADISLARK